MIPRSFSSKAKAPITKGVILAIGSRSSTVFSNYFPRLTGLADPNRKRESNFRRQPSDAN